MKKPNRLWVGRRKAKAGEVCSREERPVRVKCRNRVEKWSCYFEKRLMKEGLHGECRNGVKKWRSGEEANERGPARRMQERSQEVKV